MLEMCDDGVVRCWGCGMLGMGKVRDMGFGGCGMLGCKILRMRVFMDVGYWRYGMFGMWDV